MQVIESRSTTAAWTRMRWLHRSCYVTLVGLKKALYLMECLTGIDTLNEQRNRADVKLANTLNPRS